MSEKDWVFVIILGCTAVWAISATLIAAHLSGRKSLLAFIVDDIRRSFRRGE